MKRQVIAVAVAGLFALPAYANNEIDAGNPPYAAPESSVAREQVVREILAAAVDAGEVALPEGVPGDITIERPRSRDHGDYATNVALRLAKDAGTNARALAELLAIRAGQVPGQQRHRGQARNTRVDDTIRQVAEPARDGGHLRPGSASPHPRRGRGAGLPAGPVRHPPPP